MKGKTRESEEKGQKRGKKKKKKRERGERERGGPTSSDFLWIGELSFRTDGCKARQTSKQSKIEKKWSAFNGKTVAQLSNGHLRHRQLHTIWGLS